MKVSGQEGDLCWGRSQGLEQGNRYEVRREVRHVGESRNKGAMHTTGIYALNLAMFIFYVRHGVKLILAKFESSRPTSLILNM